MKKAVPEKARKEAIIGIRTTPEIKAQADRAAQADRRSVSQWVEGLIIDALDRKGEGR